MVLAAVLALIGPSVAPAATPRHTVASRDSVAPRDSAAQRNADGYLLAVPPCRFEFPRDHASHPQYQVEWWYYTGHLFSGAREFGFETTFFRFGLPAPRDSSPSASGARDLVFLHLALTDEQGRKFLSHDAAHRAAPGVAGTDSMRCHVWLEDSEAYLDHDGRTHRLRGNAPQFALDLALTPLKPPVVHGKDGVSPKGPGAGNASHYYSITRLAATGHIGPLAVSGEAWMDHEFSSKRLSGTYSGWDWFSVQLDDSTEWMLDLLRRSDGTIEPLSAGTRVAPDGSAVPLARAAFGVEATGSWVSPRTGAKYPMGWRVSVPGEALDLVLEPVLEDQELVTSAMGGIVYWEGAVRVQGTRRGAKVGGRGYVELTGYTGRAPY